MCNVDEELDFEEMENDDDIVEDKADSEVDDDLDESDFEDMENDHDNLDFEDDIVDVKSDTGLDDESGK